MSPNACVVGTRGSALARAQSEWVCSLLRRRYPGKSFSLRVIKTGGDWETGAPTVSPGVKGMFTKEIEEALLAGHIDLAVHSLKDLPVDLPDGLVLGAVPCREDARDALISLGHRPLKDLPSGARVGTGSGRRKGQLLAQRPDLIVEEIRGNVPTRIGRVREGDLDAVVVAQAGLTRLGLEQPFHALNPEIMLPAVGQGALGLEMRNSDKTMADMLSALGDIASDAAVRAERAFLKALGGGCRLPIGALGQCTGGTLLLQGGVFSRDGKKALRDSIRGPVAQAELLGKQLGQRLWNRGAAEILRDEH